MVCNLLLESFSYKSESVNFSSLLFSLILGALFIRDSKFKGWSESYIFGNLNQASKIMDTFYTEAHDARSKTDC